MCFQSLPHHVNVNGDFLYIIMNEVNQYGFQVSTYKIYSAIFLRVGAGGKFIPFLDLNCLNSKGIDPLLPLQKNPHS